MNVKSDFLNELKARGFIHQCTDEAGLDKLARSEVITGYIGFDCTAPSLHVGNLVSIMLLRKLQQAGHRPIVLVGGGTTKVGDPSGKDETRKLLTDAEITANISGIESVFDKFLTFGEGARDAVKVNNADWLGGLNYIDFLRDYGRHFSVNRMLNYDSVRLRLERKQPLSFIEFNYMVLQAYDFVELCGRYGCRLQMGGSDQWGNIVEGIELGRRTKGVELFGLTSPLLTTASGAKMGKTARGAVWLDVKMCSPYEYWQFWRNAADDDVGRFLKLFTELPLEEIARLERLEGAELNEAKKRLAWETTALLHGPTEADRATETARLTFEEGSTSEGLPVYVVSFHRAEQGIGVQDLGVEAGLAVSNTEIRKAICNNAVSINDVKVQDPCYMVTLSDFDNELKLKYAFGKKQHILVQLSQILQTTYHVIPKGKDWAIKIAHPKEITYLIFPTQQDAWERAKALAQSPNTEAYLHSKDGKIREHHTTGKIFPIKS